VPAVELGLGQCEVPMMEDNIHNTHSTYCRGHTVYGIRCRGQYLVHFTEEYMVSVVKHNI
jgi:hypothetical protein